MGKGGKRCDPVGEFTDVSIIARADIVQHKALLALGISHDNLAVVTGKDSHPVFLHQAPYFEG
jgi:hypothetical protein